MWKCYKVNQCDNAADWDDLAGVELYSHSGDDGSCFDCYEDVNVARDPKYAGIVRQLSRQLRAGWQGTAVP